MAKLIPFPPRQVQVLSSELSLREILRSRGIEPTEDERKRKRQEAAARRTQRNKHDSRE